MQKCENDLIFLKLSPFALLRLLHLDNQIRFSEDFVCGTRDDRTCRPVGLVRRIDAGARTSFDAKLMSSGGKFTNRVGREPYPVFVILDFLWDTNSHLTASNSHCCISL